MARFFVPKESIKGNHAVVAGPELQHLRRVLRLGPGGKITIFDDAGREHDAVIRSFASDAASVNIIRSYDAQRESALDLTLGVGLIKGDKMDFVVEKATELGVQTLIPFASTHAVPKLDERKISARTERWQKIALSAAKQCGRSRIPKVLPLCDFRQLVEQARENTLKLLFWEKEARQSLSQVQGQRSDARAVLLAVGPEGGFSAGEAALATEHGFTAVSLGRRVVRAETAAVVAVSLAQFLWGDLH